MKLRHSLAKFEPKLIKDWDFKRNKANPKIIKPYSKKKIYWQCHLDNRHKWQSVLANRVSLYKRKGQYLNNKNVGCPYCNPGSTSLAWEGYNLLKKIEEEKPQLLKFWHEKNKKLLKDIMPGTMQEYWWKCQTCNKPYKSRPNQLFRKGRRERRYCNTCARKEAGKSYIKHQISTNGSLIDKLPDVKKFWVNKKNRFSPNEISYSSHKKAWFRCEYGHKPYQAIISNFYFGTRCPKCYVKASISEIRIYTELNHIFPKQVFWQKKIFRKEADIFLKNYNLIIEIDGYPWHLKREKFDQEKTNLFKKKGFNTLRIRDPKLKPIKDNIIKSVLTNYKFSEFKKLLNYLNKLKYEPKINDLINLNRYSREKDFRKIFAELPKPPSFNSLASTNPKISKEFDLIKNKPLTPEHFTHGSGKKVWWICEKNHSWQTSIMDRTRKKTIDSKGRVRKASHCPICAKN